jgi:hypothetical protein
LITDANGLDKLQFGEGITKDDITITQEADGFVYIRINNTTDVVKPCRCLALRLGCRRHYHHLKCHCLVRR